MRENRWLAVVIHDVAPATWPACQRLIESIREVASVPLTLLLVPHYGGRDSGEDTAFMRDMRAHQARGDELALHGYTHVDEVPVAGPLDWARRRIYTREGEFASLSAAEAERRIDAGKKWFEAQGLQLQGFVAPAWLMSGGAREALLAHSSFGYTSSLRQLYLLPESTAVSAPSLVYSSRAAWRRAASRVWNPIAMRLSGNANLVRLGLHPIDAEYAAIRRSWQGLLARLLETRTPITKSDYVASLRTEPAPAY